MMNKNWLIGLFYYEGTLIFGRLVPFWVILAVIVSHGVSMFHNGNVRAQKANEKANRPPKELTVDGLVEECRRELDYRGHVRTKLDIIPDERILIMCNPNGYLKYRLVDDQGNVLKENDPANMTPETYISVHDQGWKELVERY